MEGSQHSKSRSRDPFATPFDLIFIFFRMSLVSLVINMHAKFEVSISNRFRDMEGVSNFKKSRSHDPFATLFDLIFIFFRRSHRGLSLCQI